MSKREIKFRAWDNFNSEMYYPDGNGYFFDKFSHEDFVIDGNGRPIYLCDMSTPVNVELMQYTGLTDANGTEIYEGDVVEIDLYEYAGVKETQTLAIGENSGNRTFLTDVSYLTGMKSEHIKILGNKFENPELLEVEHE